MSFEAYESPFGHAELMAAWAQYLNGSTSSSTSPEFDDFLLMVASGPPEQSWALVVESITQSPAESALADVASHVLEPYLMRNDARVEAIADLARRRGDWAFVLSMTWLSKPARKGPDKFAPLRQFVRSVD